MQKLDYSALSAGDRKVAHHLYRVLLIVYSAALVLLGAFAITSSKLLPPSGAAEGYVRNEMARNTEAPFITITK